MMMMMENVEEYIYPCILHVLKVGLIYAVFSIEFKLFEICSYLC